MNILTAKNASKNVSDYYGDVARKEHSSIKHWVENNILPVIECASNEGFCWTVFNLPPEMSRTFIKHLLREMGYKVRSFRNGIVVDW